MVRKKQTTVSKRLAYVGLMVLLAGCTTTLPTVITEKYDTGGNLTERTTATVDSQVAYHNTVRQRDAEITKEPALISLDWEVLRFSNIQTVILPKIVVHERKEREAIERTPTSGEVAVSGVNGFMERLGIPLSIGGMSTVSVQSSRTSEEIKPNVTAGGDIVQAERSGEANADKSRPMTIQKSFNTITEIPETEE